MTDNVGPGPGGFGAGSGAFIKDLQSVAKDYWWVGLLRGVLLIIFGVIAVAWPGITALALVVTFGIFAVVDGILALIDAIRYRALGHTGTAVLLAILTIIIGVVALVYPTKTATVIVILIGIWAIVAGLVGIGGSLNLKDIPGSGWGWGLVSGILTVIFGILLLVWPKSGIVSVVWLIGLWAIVIGIVWIGIAFTVRKVGKTDVTV